MAESFATPACDTTAIKPVFEPTGWNTVLLDRLTWQVADYQKEAAFMNALMGWKIRGDDGTQAVLDIGDFGSAVIRGGGTNAVVQSFCFGITPWDAKKVEAELRKRGLAPVADNDGKGFESFHVKDPDGFDLQISNGNAKNRRTTPANGKLTTPAPFESTGWKTVWLDHISFTVTNYKESASFYSNLLGWKPTYDEGSQNELMIGEVGDIIIRGGNPLDPNFGRGGRGGRGRASALIQRPDARARPRRRHGARASITSRLVCSRGIRTPSRRSSRSAGSGRASTRQRAMRFTSRRTRAITRRRRTATTFRSAPSRTIRD